MQGSITERLEPIELSPTLTLLKERLAARGVGVKLGSLLGGMTPIYKAMEEMDRAGVKVRTGEEARNVLAIHEHMVMDRLLKTHILRMELYDLEAKRAIAVFLSEDPQHAGEYIGRVDRPRKPSGFLKLKIVVDVLEFKHFYSPSEAVEWLVEKIAPCVVEARRLGLPDGDPGPPSAVMGLVGSK